MPKAKEQVVEIVIQSGIAVVMNKPKGIKLIIRDCDTDGCDPEDTTGLEGNEDDGYYFEAEYPANEKI